MNMEIGTEAAQFPEKEYIRGIFVAVYKSFSITPLALTQSKTKSIVIHVSNAQSKSG
jgi:hypothetical protein